MMILALKELNEAGRNKLIDKWDQTFGSSPPPNTSQDMMRLIIGWQIQARTARSDVRVLKTAITKLLKTSPATLAPDIQLAILSGTQPKGLCLQDLLQMKMSIDWQTQRKALGFL